MEIASLRCKKRSERRRPQNDRKEAEQASRTGEGMKQREHFSVGTSIRLRNAPELRMKGSVLTSEDSLNTDAEETSL